MGFEREAVAHRRVALVAIPSVLRELRMSFSHQPVAFGFGKNGLRR